METCADSASEQIDASRVVSEVSCDIAQNTAATVETRRVTREQYSRTLCDIRNMRELEDTHRGVLAQLNQQQLLHIIEIYNQVVQNINYLFS
jgi:hypothetical protein